MNPIPDIMERLKALFLRDRLERELEEELRHHRELDEAAGISPFGRVEEIKEEVRDARGVRPLEELIADTRYALRALRRSVGFTLTVVATLGLGIGAATAVFIVVNRILLAELPYPDAERLVRIYQQSTPANRGTISVVDIPAIRDQQRSFDAFGALRPASVSVTGAGGPERVVAGRVTAGFFRALGVRASHGRLIEPTDDSPGAPRVVVVSHAFAERALGGATAAVGKVVPIEGVSHTVVGVLEPGRNDLAGFAGVVWPVLLLAIANVATLALVRTSAREHELSVRAALGAGRRRLAWLIVTECLTLTAIAGAVGVTSAAVALKGVGGVAPGLPRLREVAFETSGVAFAAIATLVAGVLVSVAPFVSLFAGGSSLAATLGGSPARAGPGRRARATRPASR